MGKMVHESRTFSLERLLKKMEQSMIFLYLLNQTLAMSTETTYLVDTNITLPKTMLIYLFANVLMGGIVLLEDNSSLFIEMVFGLSLTKRSLSTRPVPVMHLVVSYVCTPKV